jgi:hypothetical protein
VRTTEIRHPLNASPSGSGEWKGIRSVKGFDLRLIPEKLGEPLRWSEPKMIQLSGEPIP